MRAIQGGRLFARSTEKFKHRASYLKKLLSTLVEQGWIDQRDGLYSLNAPDLLPSAEQSVRQVAQHNLDIEQHVEQMLSSNQSVQNYVGQGLPSLVEQNVEPF